MVWLVLFASLAHGCLLGIRDHLYQSLGRSKALGKFYFLPRLPGSPQRCCTSGKLAQLGLKSSLNTAHTFGICGSWRPFGIEIDCSAE